mgnify:CR=1 FL=1
MSLATFYFTSILPSLDKKIIRIIDLLGRNQIKTGLQLEIYNDGSVEKKYLIKAPSFN